LQSVSDKIIEAWYQKQNAAAIILNLGTFAVIEKAIDVC